jgi:hypothetical protein
MNRLDKYSGTNYNGEKSNELVVLDTEQNVVEKQPSFTNSILSYQRDNLKCFVDVFFSRIKICSKQVATSM